MRAVPNMRRRHVRSVALLAVVALLSAACGTSESDGANGEPEDAPIEAAPTEDAPPEAEAAEPAGPLTVYSGRSEELVGQVFADFTAATGIEVNVRYGNTAELAGTIMEEGAASPADLYYAQDAGALGAVHRAGRLQVLPDDILSLVDEGSRSADGTWVGVTGRVRVLAYNTTLLDEADVPSSVFDLTDPQWQGRIGWAPTNGSFQAFVTAMRQLHGEDVAREWLEGIIANDPVEFPNNTTTVDGVGRGEVEIGIVNHYYLFRFLAEDPSFPVANKYLPGDIGGLNNVAGIGILDSSDQPEAAAQLIRFLLSQEVQEYFGQVADALEFPLRTGVDSPLLPSIAELDPPPVDLNGLEDLEATLELLRSVGAFE
ncbi:MAG: iron ABC transporter substrate-binding protein [Nitriliruptoraceae bacterium]